MWPQDKSNFGKGEDIKFGKGEDVKRNAIKLVKALLLLAYKQAEQQGNRSNQAVEAEWISLTNLRVTGRRKQKTARGRETPIKGTKLPELVQIVEISGDSIEPVKPISNSGDSKEKKQAEAVRNAIHSLEELGVLEDNRPKNRNGKPNTPYWIFTLTLKHQTAGEDNLKWIEQKWKELSGPKYPETLQTTPTLATDRGIDWHHICQKMLEDHQREKQKFRRQITGRGLGHEVNVYVPLGLVKPQQTSQRGKDFNPSAERGMRQDQLTDKAIDREYKHDEFFQQVIEKSDKNFTITGEPGAGKSTWLEQIAIYLDKSKKNLDFPICISLESLGGKSLEDYLLQNWLKDALRFMPDILKVTPALEEELIKLFKSGKVWLLLDGVDEMRVKGESPLQAIANQLTAWVAQARVVLTCRLNLWEANPNALPNFDTYSTLHFKDEQVADFIQQWFTKAGKPELGEGLQDKLGESGRDRIRDLIKNPLRLAMMCGIWDFHQDFPETKAILYQQFKKYFYEWKKEEFPTTWTQRQELNAALSRLALKAIQAQSPLRESLIYDRDVMGESLFQLARDLGWLNFDYKDVKTGEDVYAFFHLTFQEYFAACAIDDNWHFFFNHVPNNPKQGTYRIFEPQWREVILLWLGRQDVEREQKEQFIQALVEFDDGIEHRFYWFRAYFFAVAAIAEFCDCIIADKIIKRILDWDWQSFYPKHPQTWIGNSLIKVEAYAALLQTDRTKAINSLIDFIQNNANLDLQFAFNNLAIIGKGNPTAIRFLLYLVKNYQDEEDLWDWDSVEILGDIANGHKETIALFEKLILNLKKKPPLMTIFLFYT